MSTNMLNNSSNLAANIQLQNLNPQQQQLLLQHLLQQKQQQQQQQQNVQQGVSINTMSVEDQLRALRQQQEAQPKAELIRAIMLQQQQLQHQQQRAMQPQPQQHQQQQQARNVQSLVTAAIPVQPQQIPSQQTLGNLNTGSNGDVNAQIMQVLQLQQQRQRQQQLFALQQREREQQQQRMANGITAATQASPPAPTVHSNISQQHVQRSQSSQLQHSHFNPQQQQQQHFNGNNFSASCASASQRPVMSTADSIRFQQQAQQRHLHQSPPSQQTQMQVRQLDNHAQSLSHNQHQQQPLRHQSLQQSQPPPQSHSQSQIAHHHTSANHAATPGNQQHLSQQHLEQLKQLQMLQRLVAAQQHHQQQQHTRMQNGGPHHHNQQTAQHHIRSSPPSDMQHSQSRQAHHPQQQQLEAQAIALHRLQQQVLLQQQQPHPPHNQPQMPMQMPQSSLGQYLPKTEQHRPSGVYTHISQLPHHHQQQLLMQRNNNNKYPHSAVSPYQQQYSPYQQSAPVTPTIFPSSGSNRRRKQVDEDEDDWDEQKESTPEASEFDENELLDDDDDDGDASDDSDYGRPSKHKRKQKRSTKKKNMTHQRKQYTPPSSFPPSEYQQQRPKRSSARFVGEDEQDDFEEDEPNYHQRGISDSNDDSNDENYGRSSTASSARKRRKKKHMSSSSAQKQKKSKYIDLSDSDIDPETDIIWKYEEEGDDAEQADDAVDDGEQPLINAIGQVLDHRKARHLAHDAADGDDADQLEYLIHWENESYIYDSWHTVDEVRVILASRYGKGSKKLDNYITKNVIEVEQMRERQTAEELEQLSVQREMLRLQRKQWINVDRVIGVRQQPRELVMKRRALRRFRLQHGRSAHSKLVTGQSATHTHHGAASKSTSDDVKMESSKKQDGCASHSDSDSDSEQDAQHSKSNENAPMPVNAVERMTSDGYNPRPLLADNDDEYTSEYITQYYVKWCDLPYDQSTWEDAIAITDELQHAIDRYLDLNIGEHSRKNCQNPTPIKPRQFYPLQQQPPFLRTGGELRDYQLSGLNWLIYSWCHNVNGILADEMGLGKTIQCICFLQALHTMYSVHAPFLVVAPLSTIPAWQNEFKKWAPHLNVITYVGNAASREIIRECEWFQEVPQHGAAWQWRFNVVITTYEFCIKDDDWLSELQWNYIMIDEAHRLKDPNSLLYSTLASWQSQARLLITGTPLQNSLKELWALLHFLHPERFPSLTEFEAAYGTSTESFNQIDNITRLHRLLQPYLLRRTKRDVLKSLPPKNERILRVSLSPLQKRYYRYILTRNYRDLNKGVKGKKASLTNIIMELKKCCNHPYLFASCREEAMAQLESQSSSNEERQRNTLNHVIAASGKLQLLDKLLIRLRETGHRVLIFTQMVRVLDILAEYMALRGFLYQRLDGSMSSRDRKHAMDHFNAENSPDFAFLLSTKAGGLGLNLQTADTVVIFDSDWNPHNDLQAEARAHRIGQQNAVNIYRLVSKDSVEEDILERAKKKMILDHLVIQRMDTSGKTLAADSAGGASLTSKATNMFTNNELAKIVEFGAAQLFADPSAEDTTPAAVSSTDGASTATVKVGNTDKLLNEMDIDEILERAEPASDKSNENDATDQFLSAFKVANFKSSTHESAEGKENGDGEEETATDWSKIIPAHMIPADQLLEQSQWDEQQVIVYGPRRRVQTTRLLGDLTTVGSASDISMTPTTTKKRGRKPPSAVKRIRKAKEMDGDDMALDEAGSVNGTGQSLDNAADTRAMSLALRQRGLIPVAVNECMEKYGWADRFISIEQATEFAESMIEACRAAHAEWQAKRESMIKQKKQKRRSSASDSDSGEGTAGHHDSDTDNSSTTSHETEKDVEQSKPRELTSETVLPEKAVTTSNGNDTAIATDAADASAAHVEATPAAASEGTEGTTPVASAVAPSIVQAQHTVNGDTSATPSATAGTVETAAVKTEEMATADGVTTESGATYAPLASTSVKGESAAASGEATAADAALSAAKTKEEAEKKYATVVMNGETINASELVERVDQFFALSLLVKATNSPEPEKHFRLQLSVSIKPVQWSSAAGYLLRWTHQQDAKLLLGVLWHGLSMAAMDDVVDDKRLMLRTSIVKLIRDPSATGSSAMKEERLVNNKQLYTRANTLLKNVLADYEHKQKRNTSPSAKYRASIAEQSALQAESKKHKHAHSRSHTHSQKHAAKQSDSAAAKKSKSSSRTKQSQSMAKPATPAPSSRRAPISTSASSNKLTNNNVNSAKGEKTDGNKTDSHKKQARKEQNDGEGEMTDSTNADVPTDTESESGRSKQRKEAAAADKSATRKKIPKKSGKSSLSASRSTSMTSLQAAKREGNGAANRSRNGGADRDTAEAGKQSKQPADDDESREDGEIDEEQPTAQSDGIDDDIIAHLQLEMNPVNPHLKALQRISKDSGLLDSKNRKEVAEHLLMIGRHAQLRIDIATGATADSQQYKSKLERHAWHYISTFTDQSAIALKKLYEAFAAELGTRRRSNDTANMS